MISYRSNPTAARPGGAAAAKADAAARPARLDPAVAAEQVFAIVAAAAARGGAVPEQSRHRRPAGLAQPGQRLGLAAAAGGGGAHPQDLALLAGKLNALQGDVKALGETLARLAQR